MVWRRTLVLCITWFSFCPVATIVHYRGKLKEINKDIFSGYMKARSFNVDCVIIGLLRNRPWQKTYNWYMGNLLNTKNSLSVFVLSVHLPLPPKKDLTDTLKVRWEAFQLWTLLKDIYPEGWVSAAPESSRGWKDKMWESIHNKLSSQNTWSKSLQCDDKEPVQGKNKLVKLNEFVKTNRLQTIKCLTNQEPSKISQNRLKK